MMAAANLAGGDKRYCLFYQNIDIGKRLQITNLREFLPPQWDMLASVTTTLVCIGSIQNWIQNLQVFQWLKAAPSKPQDLCLVARWVFSIIATAYTPAKRKSCNQPRELHEQRKVTWPPWSRRPLWFSEPHKDMRLIWPFPIRMIALEVLLSSRKRFWPCWP